MLGVYEIGFCLASTCLNESKFPVSIIETTARKLFSKLHMLQRVHQREVSVKSKKQITTSPRVGLIEMRLRPALDCLSMLSLSTRSEKSFGRPGFSEKKNPHLYESACPGIRRSPRLRPPLAKNVVLMAQSL